ncbi:2-C-methyl-D-erythritol 2,4-cyclodiphosphate synthase [Desulfatirhabdium butyrativorans]|uniref:2-C-methyl-D-erythritol 2,4-cyclodiphosphate synthase n=1 Tax=Desulfatirhabdium butyrativorans TaxID=340467 RepID=UPI00041FCCD7|nr:2-C-methyl-D-erythritol 2,4-cyclodiphosphate synthase [Desulfatirhabdium butyrativorans]
MYRTGIGFDIHRLQASRRLVLGGVEIPFEKGLLGHSDADVLTHAVCDAILGAAGLGDIGIHFPDTDPRYCGIDSLVLLRRTVEMAEARGYAVVNIDVSVLAEAPKLKPYRERMQETLAGACGVNPDAINIKATTMETLGEIGRGEAIAAMAVALIRRVAASADARKDSEWCREDDR